MQASFALQIVPHAETLPQKLAVIDAVIAAIKESGLNYEVAAFETTVEGDYAELMPLLERLHKLALEKDPRGLSSYIKISIPAAEDYLSIEDKVAKHRR